MEWIRGFYANNVLASSLTLLHCYSCTNVSTLQDYQLNNTLQVKTTTKQLRWSGDTLRVTVTVALQIYLCCVLFTVTHLLIKNDLCFQFQLQKPLHLHTIYSIYQRDWMVGVEDRYQTFITTAALPRRVHTSVHAIIPSVWLLNFRRKQNLAYCTGLSL